MKCKYFIDYIKATLFKRFLGVSLLLIIFTLVISCTTNKRKKEIENKSTDFSFIKEKGELNVLTLSGSMSYFIYKGEPKGYEYELIQDFADKHNLHLNIKLADNVTHLNEMLLNKEGDLIAYNIPITIEGKDSLLYTGREVINQQVIVQRANKGDVLLKDVTELIGKEVWVINNSKFHSRLINLNEELGGGINIKTIEKEAITQEDLIEMISRGEIKYTVSEDDLAKLNKTYFQNINISLIISHPQRSAWAVRKDMTELSSEITKWFQENENTPKYRSIIKRYFEMSKLPGDEPAPIIGPNQISPYDNYFKEYAKIIHWDWRLLASIAFQESKFYTDRISWAGATGLMGLMPKTAIGMGITEAETTEPEPSIRAAVELIRRLNKSFSKISDEKERIKFILAAYNTGSGHIYDAQALAEKQGKDPLIWENNVEESLKLKSLPEYYNDPVVKQGFCRSGETIQYVKNVIERWNYYQEKISI